MCRLGQVTTAERSVATDSTDAIDRLDDCREDGEMINSGRTCSEDDLV